MSSASSASSAVKLFLHLSRRPPCNAYCALMPAARITFAHLSDSARM
jgi:hypothetical protein